MLGAARRREVTKWRHTLAVVQAVYNWGGPRGKGHKMRPLGYMHDRMFGKSRPERMSKGAIGRALSSVATRKP